MQRHIPTCFYLSFKYGDNEREHAGRHFTDATEKRLEHWLESIPDSEGIVDEL